ncbi:MAG: hypothetical protein JXB38_13715, partial [Anaerolineales bacterium]|nr:hypothetical protein [Anaerolineales bacterium]
MADPGVNKTITRYYSLAGQRAVRKDAGGANEELYYLLTDHLGSVSAVVDASGGLVSEQRYLPFGGVRDEDYITDPINETDFGYTGQRNNAEIGWIDYRSRFLSTQIARFTQPDTIVPNLYDPQSL